MRKNVIRIIALLLVVFFVTFAFSACKRETSEYVSFTMKVKKNGTFKILQLTDTHFINSEVENKKDLSTDYTMRDRWAETAISDLINRADPDLIIVTGDAIFTLDILLSFTETNDNYAAFQKFAKYIDSFNIPWAFLFGNHDEEGSLHARLHGDVDETKRILGAYLNSKDIKNCMYTNGPEEINGIGNYIINVVNRDGTTNNSLVLFDSGSYLRGIVDEADGKAYADQRKYEYVHDDQLDWYEKAIEDISRIEKKKVNSIVFQHIPMPVYQTVIDAAVEALGENWQDTINEKWTYGKELKLNTSIGEIIYHGGICEEANHEVCCSFIGTFHGKSFDGGHEFERLLKVGSTKYVFCGHDHRNTFSITYKGIRLSYGMSIDYSANGIFSPPIAENQTIFDDVNQRGGTLITLQKDSNVKVEQLPFTRNLYRETLEVKGLKS